MSKSQHTDQPQAMPAADSTERDRLRAWAARCRSMAALATDVRVEAALIDEAAASERIAIGAPVDRKGDASRQT